MQHGIRQLELSFVNSYLVEAGDGHILIDTGMAQQWARLEAELLRLGCLPDQLTLVVLTHGDPDHAGNCAQLQARYGVRVAMNPGDLPMVETGLVPKREVRGILTKVMMALVSRTSAGLPTFHPDLLLEDGQDLAAYGLEATVLHTPGHTSGSLALLTTDGQLFVGDTISNRRRPAGAPFIQDRPQLQASIARLQGLAALTVYPGHGRPFPFEELQALRTARGG